jgi:hypothetical protein
MSGRIEINTKRDAAEIRPRARGSILDLLLGAFALIAVASLAYVGLSWWLAPKAPRAHPPQASLAQSSADPGQIWTAEDTSRCEHKAGVAAKAPLSAETALANASVTTGFAHLATMIECRITTKQARFCDPAEKAALVAIVTDYLGRVDLIAAALAVQGAPMEMLAGMNSEIAAGSDIYNLQKDQTLEFMLTYHRRIGNGLRELGAKSLLAPSDFAAFMGMGIPPAIKKLFEGVTPGPSICG